MFYGWRLIADFGEREVNFQLTIHLDWMSRFYTRSWPFSTLAWVICWNSWAEGILQRIEVTDRRPPMARFVAVDQYEPFEGHWRDRRRMKPPSLEGWWLNEFDGGFSSDSLGQRPALWARRSLQNCGCRTGLETSLPQAWKMLVPVARALIPASLTNQIVFLWASLASTWWRN